MQGLTKLVAALLMLTSTAALYAQNVKVTGRVVDDSGIPLVAVTVMEVGSQSNGTVTDIDGNYSISVPAKGTILFSCLGFAEIREAVNGRAVINVTLKEEQLSI